MLWVVRGTLRGTHEDVSIVVEAKSRAEAEYMGERRGIPVVLVSEATPEDVRIARAEKRLWKYTPESRYKCFGRPVSTLQLACLMLCGLLTVVLLLKNTDPPLF